MSDLAFMLDQIRNADAAIAKAERSLTAEQATDIERVGLLSLVKHKRQLERQFEELAASLGYEICSYRVIPTAGVKYSIAAIGDSLRKFQEYVTVVYDSIRNGPKDIARLGPEIVAYSTLEFGYSFSGSLGFVFVVPREPSLLSPTDLDVAVEQAFTMSKAKSAAELATYAQTRGKAAIRKLYEWIDTNASEGYSAEVRWRPSSSEARDVVVQFEEATRLKSLISVQSEEKTEPFASIGTLVGIDEYAATFRMVFPRADAIRGRLAADFDFSVPAKVPHVYFAEFTKKSKTYLSTEKDEITYTLLRLHEPKANVENEQDA